ncbi:MAG: lipoyl domain-containing protein [Gemmataceae bacterium]|nr:lipoyl domain-containing protein [Gemmataceae bacterium]
MAPPVLVPIVVPDLGTPQMVLSVWYARPGEIVYAGERVAEILIPGATVDIPAPADGVLAQQCYSVQQKLQTGNILGYLDVSSAATSSF